jgi:hypothetical protein
MYRNINRGTLLFGLSALILSLGFWGCQKAVDPVEEAGQKAKAKQEASGVRPPMGAPPKAGATDYAPATK